MRVVHLSRYDRGGGISAAYRLHDALRRLGHESLMFVAERRSDDPSVVTYRAPGDPMHRARRRLKRLRIAREFRRYRASRPKGFEGFSDDRAPGGRDLLFQLPPADLINVHSMFQFVDFDVFFRLVPPRVPVIRTLHDMSFFTGGCHLDAGCGRYRQGCGSCPQLGSQDERDLSRRIWERKQSALETVASDRLHIITPSRWLAEAVRQSPLLRRFPVTVIPHGVDLDVFAPRNQRFARDVLGLPQDKQVALFVAEPVHRPVKRFSTLVSALERIPDNLRPLLVTAGSGGTGLEVPFPHLHLGDVRNERFLSLVYSAADVIVVPSQSENFPLTVLEAHACGVPAVGSAVGGIAEIVRDGITGVLVPADDTTALAVALRELLGDSDRRSRMALASRQLALEEYSLEIQARRYAEVYAQMLQDQPSTARAGSGLPVG